tara:strand:+ start:537 stop:791 length:255 start_codon:yes stop_codon:yes gene_type:complete
MKGIIISFMLLSALGCTTTIEILDGLCFNDKDGTYLCEEPIREHKQPEKECPEEKKTYHGHCIEEDIWLEDPTREKYSKYNNVA